MRSKAALATLIMAALGAPLVAHAGAKAYPSALSARLVRFVYNPNQTYTIYTRPGMETDLRIPAGSQLVGLVLGDTTRWITSGLGNSNNVFIKPVAAGLETSGTLVTTHRTYQVMFVSRSKGAWYQQVQFNPSTPIALYNSQAAKSTGRHRSHSAKTHNKSQKHPHTAKRTHNAFKNIDLAKMQFKWSVKGRARFRPSIVFSSPSFIWLKVPSGAPAPVIFGRNSANEPWQIVNYDKQGPWDVVQGSPSALRLVADGKQVFVVSHRYKASSNQNAVTFSPLSGRENH